MAFNSLTKTLTASQAAVLNFKASLGSDQVKPSLSSTSSPVYSSLVSSPSYGSRIFTQKVCRSIRKKTKKNMLNMLVSQFWGINNRFNLLMRNSIRNTASIHSSSPIVVARLFGPAIFEASKLRVFFLGIEDDKHPREEQRTYTLTHSDISAKLTLAISREINKAQIMGWYSRLQRDEVLAEWKKVQGLMSLHVHCHISGGHWLHNLIAKLRFYIFRKELPVVLEAFQHGDQALFEKHPDLKNALVWVYFHSNVKEYNLVECWGPLVEAAKTSSFSAKQAIQEAFEEIEREWPKVLRPQQICSYPCECCSRNNLIPLPDSFNVVDE